MAWRGAALLVRCATSLTLRIICLATSCEVVWYNSEGQTRFLQQRRLILGVWIWYENTEPGRRSMRRETSCQTPPSIPSVIPHEDSHHAASTDTGPEPQCADAWPPSLEKRAKWERSFFTVILSQSDKVLSDPSWAISSHSTPSAKICFYTCTCLGTFP